ncbi:hypothetical protein EJB05_26145 [Eragrostis curvula]|uniref:Fe2OG dioxygenase domain-containing protein n=1 Tax=Eragrostis curvula TaxID=38414 RepID=A0A5J9UK31_9POAL|nr:hypothetical protein EJB05_26145 [Eragrostis curvula]
MTRRTANPTRPQGSAPRAGAGAAAWSAGSGGGGMRWRASGGCGSAPASSPPTSRRASSPRSKEDTACIFSIFRYGMKDGSAAMCTTKAMRFGDLPSWANELSMLIREAICVGDVSAATDAELTNEDEYSCPLPSELLWREPFFDQLIANRYKPGEGICAHVDLMRFDDGIAIISLESACVMQFSQAEPGGTARDILKQGDIESTKVPVHLSPGSLVLMSGDARYLWKHGINRKPGAQLWDGRELEQDYRTSVTMRKLLASPN